MEDLVLSYTEREREGETGRAGVGGYTEREREGETGRGRYLCLFVR